MKPEIKVVDKPLIVLYEEDGNTVCQIHPREGDNHEIFGILAADIVRHIANAFEVPENRVWKWVDKERYRPTDKIDVVKWLEDRDR